MSNSKRIEFIDTARGIALVAVIVGHSCPTYISLAKAIFLWHMPFFFCASGLLFNPRRPFAEIFKNKGRNLMTPYAATVACWYLYWLCIYRFITDDHNSPVRIAGLIAVNGIYATGYIVPQLPSISGVGALWFLPALFLANMIFWGITRTSSTNLRVVLAVIATIMGVKLGKIMVLPWSLDIALATQIFLVFGFVALPQLLEHRNQKMIALTAALWVVIAFYTSDLSMNNRLYHRFPICVAGAWAGTILVFQIARAMEIVPIVAKAFAYIGRAAIVILCFHAVDTTWGHFDTFVPHYDSIIADWPLHAALRLGVCLAIFEGLKSLKRIYLKAYTIARMRLAPSVLIGQQSDV